MNAKSVSFTVATIFGTLALSLASVASAQSELRLDAPPTSGAPATTPQMMLFDIDLNEGDWNDNNGGWRYRSRPGIWAAGLDGTVGKGDHKVDVDASFSDLFEKLDIGLSMDFEVGKGPVSFIFFGMWQSFGTDVETAAGGFTADVDIDFAILDGALAYNLLDKSFGDSPGSNRFTLDVLGGVRWTYLSSEVAISGGPFGGTENSRDVNWFDPYVGLRGTYHFNEKLNVSALVTGGGFGVGSDFAWSAQAVLEYRIWRKLGIFGGYKIISYDYDKDGFIWDVNLAGPVIGLTWRW